MVPTVLDDSGQPTPRARAYTVREVIEARLARLQEIPLDMLQHGGNAKRLRAGALQDAVEHLQAAIEALELASRE
jgi:hypothetical protein